MEGEVQSTQAGIPDELVAFLQSIDLPLSPSQDTEPIGGSTCPATLIYIKDEWQVGDLPLINPRQPDDSIVDPLKSSRSESESSVSGEHDDIGCCEESASEDQESTNCCDHLSGGSMVVSTCASKEERSRVLATRRRASYRRKKKSELHELRAIVTALTTQKNEMAARYKTVASQLQRPTSTSALVPGWRGIALRQLHNRLEAESLNRELRVQVRTHQLLTQHLESAWRLREMSIGQSEAGPLLLSKNKPKEQLYDDDRRKFAMLMSEVDNMYQQTDAIFEGCDLSFHRESPSSEWYSNKWSWHASGSYVECVEVMELPFELRDAVRSLMKSLPKIFEEDCVPAVYTVPDPNTFAIKFQFDYRTPAQRGFHLPLYQCWSIFKLYYEKDRVVNIYRRLTTEQDTKLDYIEDRWSVARPKDPSGTLVGTTVHSYIRIKPTGAATTPAGAVRAQREGGYLDMTARYLEDDALEIAEAIENVLLDDRAAAHVDRDDRSSSCETQAKPMSG